MSELYDKYLGKVYEQDFTKEEIEADFPEHDVRILKLTTLALAGFKPERLRVWIDDTGTVIKIVEG